jgi:hypothetical protein
VFHGRHDFQTSDEYKETERLHEQENGISVPPVEDAMTAGTNRIPAVGCCDTLHIDRVTDENCGK